MLHTILRLTSSIMHCNACTLTSTPMVQSILILILINTVVIFVKRHHNAEPTCRTLQSRYHTATLQCTFSASHWYKMQHAVHLFAMHMYTPIQC